MKSKKELRLQMKLTIAAQGTKKPRVDEGILQNLINLSLLSEARSLAAFLAIEHEPDLKNFLQHWLRQDKQLLLPRFNSRVKAYELVPVNNLQQDLEEGHYGIWEPAAALDKIEFTELFPQAWLIPGLAFSPDGARLGRGAGYYDRLLAKVKAPIVGVCLEYQILPEIPSCRHDVKMHYLLTETRIVNCTRPQEQRW